MNANHEWSIENVGIESEWSWANACWYTCYIIVCTKDVVEVKDYKMFALPIFALKVYHVKVKKANGAWGWQGGKDLAETAEWTEEFCSALLDCWEDGLPEFIEVSDSDVDQPDQEPEDSPGHDW